jgi:DNA modification methylase
MGFVINKKSEFQKQCLHKTTDLRKKNVGFTLLKAAAAGGLPNVLLPELVITRRAIAELRLPKRRVRRITPEHLASAVHAIKNFGFVSPITIRGDVIVDGATRLEASKELGLVEIPCIDISHLSEPKARMLAISLNRLGETGTWDMPELKLELAELEIEGLDLTLSSFSAPELDIILADEIGPENEAEEVIPEPPLNPVSRIGDLWQLGDNRVLCANSLEAVSYERLMNGALAAAVLTDPPYNVKIAGNVSGLGKKQHGEFQMGSGELTAAEFHDFLKIAHKHCADCIHPGAVVFSFMDWRSIDLLIAAGREAGLKLINIAVWYKGSGSMGAFLRSAHELVGVFCKGDKPRLNNVELGKHGRDRTNVWVYPGANKPGSSAAEVLKDHPTPKNVEMCADALRDVTVKGEIVLDPFLGSGSSLIAAQKTGRVCHGIELDGRYVDVCIRRWEAMTGEQTVHAETGLTFREVAAQRADDLDDVEQRPRSG